jgi:polyhydroxybutyrate depolymerase
MSWKNGLSALLFVTLASIVVAQDDSKSREWQVDGVARTGLVFAPAKAKTIASPLIFAFHGHGGNTKFAARNFDYQTRWPEAIVVYLQGLNTPGMLTDPQGKKPGWQKSAGDQQDRDLKFFDIVLASIKSDYKVDDKRIYVTGHSNGGGFTYLLWSERPDTFAAIAPSSAVPNRAMKDSVKPIPILHLASKNDQLVKFEWQEKAMELVRRINGCAAEGKPWASKGSLVGTIYASEKGTPFVELISPGTHTFPPEAPELIVKFFKEHHRE